MCGRFSLGATNLTSRYNLIHEVNLIPHFNVAPGMSVPVVIFENGQNTVKFMRWGFQFKNSEGAVQTIINAKGETLQEKVMFKKLLTSGRCLLPATGFFEWQRIENGKIPHHIFLKNQQVFSLGGLYKVEKNELGENVLCCVVITISPNDLMKPIHNRMPLIIDKRNEQKWLESQDLNEVQSLIQSYSSKLMQAVSVSKKVNSAANDSPDLIEEFKWEV